MGEAAKKIVWAVDAFEEQDKIYNQSIHAVEGLMPSGKTKIEPVYVLSPDQLNLPLEINPPWTSYYIRSARRLITERLKKLKFLHPRSILEPTILVQKRPSLKQSVLILTRYAQKNHADLILTATHARKGFSRAVLGSFAETLLLFSKIPVFIINPEVQIPKSYKHIVFATDFSPHCNRVFKRILALARDIKAHITLFHVILHPIEPLMASGVHLLGGVWMPVETYLQDEKAERLKKAKPLLQMAERMHVPVDVEIRTDTGSVSECILNFAKENHANLIGVGAQTKGLGATIIGSVTKQVVRNAKCPVWVVHS